MNTAILFPGQGAQKPGMLHELPEHPAVDVVLAEMTEVLGYDAWELDSETALQSTVSAQLALLAAGVATARMLTDSGVKPVAVLGISVGAFAAAVATQAISLANAARLVHFRAEQMEKMFPSGYGMAAIVGLSEMQVTKLVQEISTDAEPVFAANINAPRQIAIAGAVPAMKRVLLLAVTQGAHKAELLHVAVPSHCPLMEPVARSLKAQLATIRISDPTTIYIANMNARAIRSAEGIRMDLAESVAHGVRWDEATNVAQELGCNLFLQAPPGRTLVDLARDDLEDIEAHAVTGDNFKQVVKYALSEKEIPQSTC